MAKIIDVTGKGAAISGAENDSNLSTLAGINVTDATNSRTVDIDDQGATIEFTFAGAVAVTLEDIATIYNDGGGNLIHTDNFTVTLIATGASTVATITPDGTDSINTGVATIVLTTDEYVTIQTDGTGAIWNVINSNVDVALKTSPTLTNPVLNGAATGTAIGRGALVYMSGNQTISTATYTPVEFDTETYDTDTIHDNSTNNTRFTIPSGVTKVKLKGQAMWPGGTINQGTTVYAGFRKNGVGNMTSDAGYPFNRLFGQNLLGNFLFNGQRISSSVIDVVATDYLELIVYQNTGGNVDLEAEVASLGRTWFSLEIVK